jgi:dTDP-4-dehydrorhamnose 3,5-epimerase
VIFHETPLRGAFLVEIERHVDDRGFFARTFAQEEFALQGLVNEVVHASIAWNSTQGTIRGMHFQHPPHAEVKLVRCTRGAIHDVIVDLRPESPTFLLSHAVRLDSESRRSLYVPERFAHGYQVLLDQTEVLYQMSAAYAADAQGGIRFDDPVLDLEWPLPVSLVSSRDLNWPMLETAGAEIRHRMGPSTAVTRQSS